MSDGAGSQHPQTESAQSDEEILGALAESIQQLTPSQRRRLWRRLRVSGLLDSDELLTDRERLRVAPALGVQARRRVRRARPKPRPAGQMIPANPPDDTPPRQAPSIVSKSEPYRSAISGKIVKGAPTNDVPLEPHGMAPLPGQAPEQPIVVIFDGGSRGNPGQGFGSYALRWPGQSQQVVQLRFGDRVTSHEAEYDTLIAALEAVLQRLADSGAPSKTAKVEVSGNSLLVISQVLGSWEADESRLQVRRDRVRELLDAFGSWQLTHVDREDES